MMPGVPRDVLMEIALSSEPLCSRDLLALVETAQTGTEVCRALYKLRHDGHIEEVGTVPSETKTGRPLRTYVATASGLAEIDPSRPAAKPAAAGAKSDKLTDLPASQPASAGAKSDKLTDLTAAPPPAQDAVMRAIHSLARPAPEVTAADIERLLALANTPPCAGAVGDWLCDLAVRLGQEVRA